MADFFGLFGDEDKNKEVDATEKIEDAETVEDRKLMLREEELDIAKDRVETGEVNLHKEVVEEVKEVDVPVSHEEVVIERRAIDDEPTDEPISAEETIHIPVTEERVEVGKHTVVTGEVMAHKRAIEENEHIEESLKREEARVETTGDPNLVADETDGQLH